VHDMPDAVILCGGQGTRIRSVLGDCPKSMARIAGQPFLEILLNQVETAGWRRVVLCSGYGREALRRYFASHRSILETCFCEEETPLGTGGALLNALSLLRSDAVLVMNGDSYVSVDLAALYDRYRQLLTKLLMVIVPTDGRNDAGRVVIDSGYRITGFAEKTDPTDNCFYNAGVYLISRPLLETATLGRSISLERELIPQWIPMGIHAFIHNGPLLDIGTPERLATANAFFERQARIKCDCEVPKNV